MIIPQAQSYIELIRGGRGAGLSFLRNYQFELQPLGKAKEPFIVGQHSVTFRAIHERKPYAVRFFTAAERDSFRRWSELSFFLERSPYSWITPVHYLEEEVVLDGQAYPALLMPWVDATPLWEFIDQHVREPHTLHALQGALLQLNREMESEGIAHGDLNLHHILVNEDKVGISLRLIGYDAMYIPPFTGLPSLEVGTPGFQHPMRMADDFYPELDRFSVWIFLAGIEALAINPKWWSGTSEEYGAASLLFHYRDLMDPERSILFRTLEEEGNEALRYYLMQIRKFAQAPSLREIEQPERYDPARHRQFLEKASTSRPADRSRRAPEHRPAGESPRLDPERSSGNPEVQAASFPAETAPARPFLQTNQKRRYIPENDRSKKFRLAWWVGSAALLTLIVFLVVRFTGNEAPAFVPAETNIAARSTTAAFNNEGVRAMLDDLYSAYNNRDLDGIIEHYRDPADYYDADRLDKAALRKTIRDLFIAPASYRCSANYHSLRLVPAADSCVVMMTISERLRSKPGEAEERYDTKIRYVLDRDYRIISEKSLE